jgi:hypothetical protein
MLEKVSEDAFGINESGSSYRSSTQVPPFTGAELDEAAVLPLEGVPQAASNNTRADISERENMRSRDPGFLSILILLQCDCTFK